MPKLALILLLCCSPLWGQFADRAHPRLWMDDRRQQEVSQLIQEDPLASAMQQAVLREADAILKRRPAAHIIHDGRRLLRESRLALHQILHCVWAWRFTGDDKYLRRATAELESACTMKDWNPPHFLDVAEMALAVAIGYDWLHAELTPQQRAMCEQAIRDKALRPARRLYDGKVWWSSAINNWAQVCGGGIALAAIAVQGQDEDLSADLIDDGIELLSRCHHFYQPDGLYPEGPGYWHYGTNYHVKFIAALEALGHPSDIPAELEQSGNSMIHLHSPTQLPFNFADGRAYRQSKSPAQAWIAGHYNNHAQIRDLRKVLQERVAGSKGHTRCNPLHILWLPRAAKLAMAMPLHSVFKGEQAAATFRSGWEREDAWLAAKAGTPVGGHSQMDVGSFCYDVHGIRWFHDLGSDNYNMPGYFGSERFDYFRNQNRSHNTLEINGELQDPKARPSSISHLQQEPGKASAVMDLTPAYHRSAKSVQRSLEFIAGEGEGRDGTAVIRDEIVQPKGEVIWRAITDAEVDIEDDTVTLRKDGKSIRVKRRSSAGQWSVESASPPLEIENPNAGFRRITLTVPQQDRVVIEVAIRP